MILGRLKRLWQLSDTPLLTPSRVLPDVWVPQDKFNDAAKVAQVVPYKPRDPVKEIIGEQKEIV